MSVEDSASIRSCAARTPPRTCSARSPSRSTRTFRRHLESCAVCREEVAALQVVRDALPAAAPQLSAPAELKQRVMASVREDAQRQRAQDTEDRRAASDPLALAPGGARLAALASALAAAALAAAVDGAGARGARLGRGRRPRACIRARCCRPRASASLRVSDGRAQLDISGMPQTPPAACTRCGSNARRRAPQPTDALFTVDGGGDATVGVPGSVKGVRVVMVTAEPLGGSRVPTLPA